MALFKDAHTVVRTAGDDSEGFKVKVGVHQGAVLSPLLFALVMNLVTTEAQEGLPWEILYADDLMMLTEKMHDQLRAEGESWGDKGDEDK